MDAFTKDLLFDNSYGMLHTFKLFPFLDWSTMQLICLDEQHFSKIKEKGGVLVDKTRHMYEIFKDGTYFFISRPRRFGKSLLCSTLAALFAGKKDLFKDLWIEKSDWDWQEHPVIHLDMTRVASATYNAALVRSALINELQKVAQNFNVPANGETPSIFLGNLIRDLHQKTGKQTVVIIDEYDKPLLDVITKPEVYKPIHDELRSLYSQLKANSADLRFVLLTGVFKFAQTSVFSGLNNLKDLTFSPAAAELLGYTEHEIKHYFADHLRALEKKLSKTPGELFEILREKYNGYFFGIDVDVEIITGTIYNPFALNYVFQEQQLLKQWFISATPTALIEKLQESNFAELDQSRLVTSFGKIKASSEPDKITGILMLFYAGYLTIKGYSSENEEVALDFPNAEVAQAFSQHLLPLVTQHEETGLIILAKQLKQALLKEEPEKLQEILNQALAQLPYHLFGTQESYYQTVIYLLLNAGNCVTIAEDMMNRGRADITVLLPKSIYIFELKMNQPAAVAIEQIKQRNYTAKYTHLNRKIYLIGIELSNQDRIVKELLIEASCPP